MSQVQSNVSGSPRPYLTCLEMLNFIMAYLDNELDAEQRFDFDRHLKVCPSCQNYLASYQQTIKLGKIAMSDLNAPAESVAPKHLIEAIRAARRNQT